MIEDPLADGTYHQHRVELAEWLRKRITHYRAKPSRTDQLTAFHIRQMDRWVKALDEIDRIE